MPDYWRVVLGVHSAKPYYLAHNLSIQEAVRIRRMHGSVAHYERQKKRHLDVGAQACLECQDENEQDRNNEKGRSKNGAV